MTSIPRIVISDIFFYENCSAVDASRFEASARPLNALLLANSVTLIQPTVVTTSGRERAAVAIAIVAQAAYHTHRGDNYEVLYDRVHNCPNGNVHALNGELEPSSKGVPLSHTHSLFAHHSITNLGHTLLSSIANAWECL